MNERIVENPNQVISGFGEKIKSIGEQFNTIKRSSTTYNLLNENCVGDGITDNKEIIENIFNKLKNGDSLYIPYGTYLIKLSDTDLKDSGMTRKPIYPWLILNGIENLTIFGEGTLKFECDENMTKKASVLLFRDCHNITLKGFSLIGDVVFNSEIFINDVGLNGINLERCNNSLVDGIKIYNMLAVLGVSGDINTPSTTNIVNNDTIITNCLFKNYGQVSTFGSGVSRLIFSDNICINPLQSAFKVSTNVSSLLPLDKANNIIISNNIVYWDENYRFAKVGWDLGKTYCPVGFMVESHTNNIKISNNIVDLSKIKDTLVSPITDYAPIFIFGSFVENNLTNMGIEINNNKLHSVNSKPSIIFNPNVKSIIISDNELIGGLNGRTFTINNIEKTKGIYIKGNVFLSDFQLSLKNVKTKTVVIKGNVALNEIEKTLETIIIEENEIDYLIIDSNKLPNEILKTYNELTSLKVEISNNIIKQISKLDYNNISGILTIKNNTFTTTATLTTLNILNSDTIINYIDNISNTSGSVITLNQGNLYLGFNTTKAKTGNPFNLGSAIVQTGLVMGNGAPSMDAGVGVMYRNLSTLTSALYLKISDGSGADKWKLLA